VGLIIGTILAFAFLETPWQYLALIPLALWEALELYLFFKWRGVPSVMGLEALVGRRGRAVTDCRPDGQVRLRGEVWRARCPEGVKSGDEVEVASVDGLVVNVFPVHSSRGDQGSTGTVDTQSPTA
jgi:membrane protein implicated in regulation of membrane protease activity